MIFALAIARFVLAASLLAIVVWVVAWTRARPDLCPRWLAAKLVLLLTTIAASAVLSGLGHGSFGAVLFVTDAAAVAVALRLWIERRWLLRAPDVPHEARRLTDAALDLTATVQKDRDDAT